MHLYVFSLTFFTGGTRSWWRSWSQRLSWQAGAVDLPLLWSVPCICVCMSLFECFALFFIDCVRVHITAGHRDWK